MRERHRDALALLILVLGVSLFHWRGLRPGYTFLPVDLANNNLPWRSGPPQPLQNWLISDPLYEFYPFLDNAVKTIRDDGSWPLWNPRILLGHPVLADPLNQPFYPFFIPLGLIFGAARGMTIGLWLHAILATVLTYGLLRTLRCRQPAAALGAFTYALGGYMVTWFEMTQMISTLVWLPGVLWMFELAVRRRSLRYSALAGIAMGLAILGGQLQFTATFSLFLGLYAIGRAVGLARRGSSRSTWPLGVFVLTVGLGVLLSAIQTVPFAEFLSRSQRTLSRGLYDPLPVQQLITLIIPDFFGNPASTVTYWGAFNFNEAAIYAGLPALLLAGLAPVFTRRFLTRHVFLVTAILLFFATGGPGIQVLGSVPVLKYLSLHRSIFLLPLLIGMLAAMALSEPELPGRGAIIGGAILVATAGLAMYLNWDRVQDHWQALQGPVIQAAGFLVATVGLLILRERYPNLRSRTEWGLVGLAFADLFLLGSQYNPAGPIDKLMPVTPAIEYLREHTDTHHVAVLQSDNQVLIGPNVLSIYGIAEAGGYSSVVLDRLQQVVTAGDPRGNVTGASTWMKQNPNIVSFYDPSRQLLDLLQVSHVVSPAPLDDPGVRAEFVRDNCQKSSVEITDTHAVTGTFVAHDTAINRVDLRFRVPRPEEAQGTLNVRLWRGADRRQLVLDERLGAAKLGDQEKVTLYFAPERKAPGQTYVWEVTAGEDTSDTGVNLCADESGQPAVSVYGVDWAEAHSGTVYIRERLAPLPRAYVVYAAEHIPDDTRAIDRLLDETFDLRNTAVTADSLDLPAASDLPATRAEIVDYKDTQVTLSASAVQRGLLILGDQFYPGWQAYVDGEPATVYRVNHVMRGVILPPGDHRVVFRFESSSLRTGGLLSVAGILALVTLPVLERRLR